MSSVQLKTRMGFDQYLSWEEAQPSRHELIDGNVFAMTGGSTAHGAVGLTLLALLRDHLKGSPCRVFWPDVKLRIGEESFYPDVKVSCAPGDLINAQYIERPVLIIEVLSPGTEDYDRGRKFDAYRQIVDLKEYLLVDPDLLTIELRRKIGPDQWQFFDLDQNARLDLQSVGFTCDAATLFADLPPSKA